MKYYLLLAHELTYIAQVESLNAQAESVGRLLHRFAAGAQQCRQRPGQA